AIRQTGSLGADLGGSRSPRGVFVDGSLGERGARAARGPSAHVGVAVVGGRDEGLLDRPGGRPAEQVEFGAGLVVGAGGAGAAEGVLAGDGAGGFVVEVEVAGGVAEGVGGAGRGGAVVGDDRAGEGVGRGVLQLGEHLFVLVVFVDVDGE